MGKTVMIVDDQIGIRLLLEEIIRSEGYQVVVAENGKEALDKITDDVPDLLIVDFKLPIMDGYAVLENLEQKNLHIPTIIMSGLSEEASKKTEKFDMVECVFAKPFDIEEARNTVNKLLS